MQDEIKSFINHKQSDKLSIFKFNTYNSYKMPDILLKCNVLQFQSALTFAAKLIEIEKTMEDEYARDHILSDHIRLLEQKHSDEISRLDLEKSSELTSRLSGILKSISDKDIFYSEKIKELQSEYDSQIRVFSREKKKLEEDNAAAILEREVALQTELRLLRRQLSEKIAELQSASKSEGIIREQCASESERLIRIIEEKNSQQINSLRESYDTTIRIKEESLEQRELRIIQKEKELETTQQRNASSSFRGQDGESYFETLVDSKMNWKLINTSKIPHSCDYSSTIHNSTVFFELKNYTADVRSDEVSKFLRDMKEHPEVHIGIFVSLNTRIAGKDSSLPIIIEWIHESQCAVYIQSFKELDTDYTLTVLDQIIKMSRSYTKLINATSTISQDSILQDRIDRSRVYIERYITETVNLIKHVSNDQKRHRELVESSYSHTLSVIKSQSTGIHTALEILTGQYEENNIIDETALQVTEAPKKTKKRTSVIKN